MSTPGPHESDPHSQFVFDVFTEMRHYDDEADWHAQRSVASSLGALGINLIFSYVPASWSLLGWLIPAGLWILAAADIVAVVRISRTVSKRHRTLIEQFFNDGG